jgi:hypothetical protein
MQEYEVIQTEKSYKSQQQNTFVIVFKDKSYKTNKIELARLLKSQGFDATNISAVNTPAKTKTRGSKRNTIKVTKPRKYYVTLKAGQQLVNKSTENTDTL